MVQRSIFSAVERAWRRGKSILLLGPRQTGKTTLAQNLTYDLSINLLSNRIRQSYERDPDILYREVSAFARKVPVRVLVDEVQKVPGIMDPIQDLVDQKKAQFVITGSSARKLKQQADLNLLPGRVISFRLDGFSISEMGSEHRLEDLLHYGSLPEVSLTADAEAKEELLQSYVEVYLEEEIRKEARLRTLQNFYHFLEHAAQQSGQICSYSGIAQDIGVSHVTVKAYYEILESTLVAERIDPIIQSRHRKRLIRSPRYIFFDGGVRRVAAREGVPLPRVSQGLAFEQLIGLELIKVLRAQRSLVTLHFWQDPEVAEVDWVLKKGDVYLPIEVKLNTRLSGSDCKHLKVFLSEYNCPKGGLVVYGGSQKMGMDSEILGTPWLDLPAVIEGFLKL